MTTYSGTINALILDRVRDSPDRIAHYHKKDGAWTGVTWAQARERAKRIAAGLRALGLKTGHTACILADTRPEWPALDYAIMGLGGATVGIYHTSTAGQVAYIVKHCDAGIIAVDGAENLRKILNHWPELPRLQKCVVIDAEAIAACGATGNINVLSLAELESLGARELAQNGDNFDATARAVKPDDLACLVYTSGTTGTPKGVMLTHRNLYEAATAAAACLPIGPEDVGIVFLPLAHILQRVAGYSGVVSGLQGYFAESLDKLPEHLRELRPTVMAAVPRVFEKVYAKIQAALADKKPHERRFFNWAIEAGKIASRRREEKLPIGPVLRAKLRLADRIAFQAVRERLGGRIKFFISGGAPLNPEIARFFDACGILILEGYGLTETSAASCLNRPGDYRFGTVGRPTPGVAIKIATDGEILIKGPGVFTGYFKDPEATREAFDGEWFKSGDIGEFDSKGMLRITDRKKDLIVTAGGKNIAPQYLENKLKSHPLISNALVHGDKRNFLTALVTLDPEEAASWAAAHGLAGTPAAALAANLALINEIQAAVDHVNREVARYESIKKFAVLDYDFSIPGGELTPTLKLKRRVIENKHRDILDRFYATDG